ncbi:transcription factor bHLH125 [Beta vulgaris subsp. vulgaris]|uniref:transcription factor bHLH125 n=1 Tax=Beta vulgaris subsp. vulgaris TaxID=3555 RepID=UPI0020374154|nr:transcription factor bHLH125 [Beta vulgaris subsp. vulgaris]XP_010677154.2 transcription factor bHLH125 [Beta vulgaris subsp. vulgaris]
MSDPLYSSLLSLLPYENIKGNSSVCDHIEVAEIYIKDLEKSIKELQDKREKLHNSLSETPNIIGRQSSISSVNPSINDNYVKIKAFSKELEIEINAMVEEDGVFPLSKVLKVVQLEEGLTIVNCAYSKVNQRWVHVIRCQVGDGKLVDSSQLQCRLTNEILSSAP